MTGQNFGEPGAVYTGMPYDANGHVIWRPDEVVVVMVGDEPMVVDAGYTCAVCGEHPRYIFALDGIKIVDPCPYPDGITTVIELKVPSGKIIVTDDLRPVYDWRDADGNDTLASYNTTLGQHQAILAMATQGCAYGPVSNTCPDMYRTGPDTYIIASPNCYDRETGDEIDPSIPEDTKVAGICTDLWAYSICDYDDYLARGGDPANLEHWTWTVVDVTPGVYRFTHHTGEPGFDHYAGEVVFAHVERIGDVP